MAPPIGKIKNHYESQHNGENIALGISDDNDDLSSTKATLILEQGDKDWFIIWVIVQDLNFKSPVYFNINVTYKL